MIIQVGIFESCIGLVPKFISLCLYLRTTCKHKPLSQCSQIAWKYQNVISEPPSQFRIIAFPSEEALQIYEGAGKYWDLCKGFFPFLLHLEWCLYEILSRITFAVISLTFFRMTIFRQTPQVLGLFERSRTVLYCEAKGPFVTLKSLLIYTSTSDVEVFGGTWTKRNCEFCLNSLL